MRFGDLAMEKEWHNWERFKATIPISDEMLARLPQDQKIIGTRWVLTYKGGGKIVAKLGTKTAG